MAPLNLPVQLTSFVGRERDLAEVRQLMTASRLVTLTGAGGCGKTRLALQVANTVSAAFADGVWLVDLVLLREPSLTPQFVAQALGVHEAANETLMGFVRPKQMLLVLDNCEHLIQACALLAQLLLSQAPHLRILATSREPLAIAGETTYYVPPLALPPGHAVAQGAVTENRLGPSEMMSFDAIRLFVERAQAVASGFRVTADNAALVAEICRRLDGIPLAIELASARIRVLSLEQISTRLEDRFSLLVSGQRIGQAPHHHTLRATLDWSYDLLAPAEQTLFRRLAVFAAGFSLDLVESVCTDDDLGSSQILALLSSLVDKSLVTAETVTRSQARYRLLETIRDYALEKLNEIGEARWLQDRHLESFVAQTEETAPKLIGPYQKLWLDWLEGENDNLRAALAWALESDQIESGLRIATALFQFWALRKDWQEGLAWFERLLDHADERIPLAVHANACTYAAYLAEWRGNSPAAIKYGRRGVELGEAAGDEGRPILGFALGGLASAMKMAGDYQAVFTLGEQFIDIFRQLDDSYAYYLGMGVLVQGQTATVLGKYELAHSLLDEALTLAREAGDPYRIAMALNFLGDLARCEQRYAQAQAPYEEAVALLRDLGAERDLASALLNLGHVHLHLGNADRAGSLFHESMALQQAQQNTFGMTEGLIGFAALAAARDLPAAAARLLAAATASGWDSRTPEWPATRMDYEQTLALARARLGEAEFQAEQAAGEMLSLGQAVEFALNLPAGAAAAPLQAGREPAQSLTGREREVAALVALGRSNGEIADELVLSKRTVEKHIANILSKLALSSRAQIVRWAIEHGLTGISK